MIYLEDIKNWAKNNREGRWLELKFSVSSKNSMLVSFIV